MLQPRHRARSRLCARLHRHRRLLQLARCLWHQAVCRMLPPPRKKPPPKPSTLDPTSAEAYSALGFATVCHDFDWAVAEGQHRRAIEINPNYATGHHWYGFHLPMAGRFDEAISEMLRARELDPLSPSIMQGLGWAITRRDALTRRSPRFRTCSKRCPTLPTDWLPTPGP